MVIAVKPGRHDTENASDRWSRAAPRSAVRTQRTITGVLTQVDCDAAMPREFVSLQRLVFDEL